MLRHQQRAGGEELATETSPAHIRIYLKLFPLFSFPEARSQECSERVLCHMNFRALESDHLHRNPGSATCQLCDLRPVT